MKSKIWLSSPHMGNAEQNFVNEAFATNWIAPLGPHVDGFEQDISTYLGGGHVAALSSGTSAIHLALTILGTQLHDEVIVQSFTFSASANPISYCGATPVFVDSEAQSWNMDPDLLETAIKDRLAKGKKVKAIIPVHLYGMPAQIDKIVSIAAKYNIPVVEDAAESLGSTYNNQASGTFGTFGVLSFNGNKIITTSGGGALVSKTDAKAIAHARFLATQARDPAPHYQHSHIGFNYRLSNVLAGIGRGQMMVLNQRIAQRRANFDFYKQLFKEIEGVSFQEQSAASFSNRWLTAILIDPAKSKVTAEQLRLAFEKENIESRPLWKPLHLQPIFESAPQYTNGISESMFEQGLCLPSGSNLSDADRERIAEVVRTMFL